MLSAALAPYLLPEYALCRGRELAAGVLPSGRQIRVRAHQQNVGRLVGLPLVTWACLKKIGRNNST